MNAFDLAWPNLRAPSAESGGAAILQTPSAEFALPILSKPSRESGQIAIDSFLKIASIRFSLPWSAYVRLLAVKNDEARRFYEMEALRDGENAPVGLILCAQKDEAVARYALDRLPNEAPAAEYRNALPDEKALVAKIERTRAVVEDLKRRRLPTPRRGGKKTKAGI